MDSSYYKSKDVLVVILEESDRKNSDFGMELQKVVLDFELHKIVIDIGKLEFILSKDIEWLERFVDFFKIGNISSILCGFTVSNASMIFNFVDEVSFKTALNIEDALHAHRDK
ncbi:hypothetical protein ThvES_00006880 [Thiovulum sp. ES]|nr:hypothetical protein ThvES_00006880 [Thiovulum sp. ES]